MTDAAAWISASAVEFRGLLEGAGRDDESALQDWLERHPAFVPGLAGPRGMSGHRPWPCALITQPRLIGFEEKVPDFCWLSVDSAELTAMMIEIERPSKRWFVDGGRPSAVLTQARHQLTQWKTWFSNPNNVVRFREDYLVPDDLRDLRFRQSYVLVYGSRAEYKDSRTLTQLRAEFPGDDEVLMSFDRLPGLAKVDFARYGCVRRSGEGFSVRAIPETWEPSILNEAALRVTQGYQEAVEESAIDAARKTELLDQLADMDPGERRRFRFRPS